MDYAHGGMPTPDNTPGESTLRRHRRYRNDVLRIVRLIGVAVAEANRLPQSIKLMEAVNALVAAEGDPVSTDDVNAARDLLPVVEAERQQGFPMFHGLAAIGIWSALEAFAEDLLLDCLANDPTLSELESVQKVKVSVAEFSAMSEDARRAHILDCLKLGTGGSPGVGGIERLYRAFGFIGSPSDEVRACLVELNAVRNGLLHRSGVADERLVQLCPWLDLEPGDDVLVSQAMVEMYAISSLVYGTDLTLRLVKHYTVPHPGLTEFMEALEPKVRRARAP